MINPNNLSDLEVFVLTLYGESRGEPVQGQIAVANVIKNRNRDIKETCLAPKQFSCWNNNDPNRIILDELAQRMLNGQEIIELDQLYWIAQGIISHNLNDNTHGARYYLTTKLFNSPERPKWAKVPKNDPIQIGSQVFFNV